MADIIHRIGIKAPIAKVYEALSTISGVAGWWSEDTSGSSKVGGTINVRFTKDGREIGNMSTEVIALEQNKKVHWRVLSGPDEWIGTNVVFDLAREDDYSIVLFGHKNWREPVEFMAHCSMKW